MSRLKQDRVAKNIMRKIKMCEIDFFSLDFFIIAWAIIGCSAASFLIGKLSNG